MGIPYQLDQTWFNDHPRQHMYQRPPFPEEWQHFSIPHEAVVTVHWINARCTVRVLKLPDGKKVATLLDTEDDLYVED